MEKPDNSYICQCLGAYHGDNCDKGKVTNHIVTDDGQCTSNIE